MRSFTPRRTIHWEFKGVMETPFVYMGMKQGVEAPLVALFKEVAREADGREIEGFQCSFPNVIGYHNNELSSIQASPIGHYKHGMHRDELDRAARMLDAAVTFKAATDADLNALMPKKQSADVIVLVPPAQAEARQLKMA